jgi:hypothetical protein
VLLHLLLWTPIVVATIISLTVKPILLDRSLIGISSALFLILGWTFVHFWNRRPTQIVAAAFLISCFASLAFAFPNTPGSNDLIRMTDYIARSARPGDAITYADWQSFDTAALRHSEQTDVYVLPGRTLDAPYWAQRMAAMRWGDPQHIASVPEFAPRYPRVWLVFTLYTYELEMYQQISQGWLEAHGQLLERVSFDRAVLFLYEVAH